jgi:hypothetical protein
MSSELQTESGANQQPSEFHLRLREIEQKAEETYRILSDYFEQLKQDEQ